mmetsp:Transcript_163941/g.398411  ORF Transcript_163941/g.398411 Transcript_163941/m.398411 type:complete len:276 (-) Transcript_163941:145-972(-)
MSSSSSSLVSGHGASSSSSSLASSSISSGSSGAGGKAGAGCASSSAPSRPMASSAASSSSFLSSLSSSTTGSPSATKASRAACARSLAALDMGPFGGSVGGVALPLPLPPFSEAKSRGPSSTSRTSPSSNLPLNLPLNLPFSLPLNLPLPLSSQPLPFSSLPLPLPFSLPLPLPLPPPFPVLDMGGCGRNRARGKSFMVSMKNFLPALKESAFMPSPSFTEKWKLLMGPKISSTLPISSLFSRKMRALKCGTLSFVHLQIKSSSQLCMASPTSST